MASASVVGAPAPQASTTPPVVASQAPEVSYAQRVRAVILPYILFPNDVEGNPVTQIRVTTRPTGEVIDAEVVVSSGSESWDKSVRRAVLRANWMPQDVDGKVPPVLIISFRPKP
ncbi:energy transducer TonB [Roseateles terrae]|uniref:energy transducer TonB n=1 Tax=Roseateles terrae TaxID=431060 RepID=UPI0035BF4D56